MVAKRPVLLHSREPDGRVLIRLGDIFRFRARVDIEIDDTTKGPPCDATRLQKNFLGMCIAEKDTMSDRRVLCAFIRGIGSVGQVARFISGKVSGVQVYRVAAVNIGVRVIAYIGSKQSPWVCQNQ